MQQVLTGMGVALVTPFVPQTLEIDWAAFDKLLSHTAPHADFWVVAGTTAEAATLTKGEKKALLERTGKWRPEPGQRKPKIVYGIGGNNTRALIEEIKDTDLSGCEAILSVNPYYSRPNSAGVVAHYTTLADASPVPLILYNVPSRTGSNIGAETVAILAKHPNILGLKEAHSDMAQFIREAASVPHSFALLSGDDALTPAMIAMGGAGTIAVMPNVLPAAFAKLVQLCLAYRFEQANLLLQRLMPFNDLLYVEGNPVGIKAAMEVAGLCSGAVRLPLVQASEALKRQIEAVMGGITLDKIY